MSHRNAAGLKKTIGRMEAAWDSFLARSCQESSEAIIVEATSREDMVAGILMQCSRRKATGLGVPFLLDTHTAPPTLHHDPLMTCRLTLPEGVALLRKECLHAALEHDTRRRGRDTKIWSMATEIVVARMVDNLPGWCLQPSDLDLPPSLHSASAERIYDFISQRCASWARTISIASVLLAAPLRACPQPGVHAATTTRQVAMRMLSTLGDLDADLPVIEEHLAESERTERLRCDVTRWFMARRVIGSTTDWKRPSRRSGKPPGRRPERKLRLAFVLDTSISVELRTHVRFVSILDYLIESACASIVLVESDREVRRITELDHRARPASVRGRGRTDLQAPLDFLARHQPAVDGIIFCTDGKAEPPRHVGVPVLWLLPAGCRSPAAWGDVLFLED